MSPSANIGSWENLLRYSPLEKRISKEEVKFSYSKRSSALGGSEIARLLENQMGDTLQSVI